MSTTQNSFMKSLFFGQIREDMIFPYPHLASETAETMKMILDTVDRFAQEHVKSAEWDEKGEMPRDIVSYMAELGLMGLAVPEDLGGLGLPQSAYARVLQEVAATDGALAVTVGAHQSIGYKALLLYGTEDQKKRYLPRLAAGQLIACYCLTEPGSGSDAASIKTRATLSPDGKHYIVNGNKLWITNGSIASFATIFAKVEMQEGAEKKEKVTCLAIELPAEGVTAGPSRAQDRDPRVLDERDPHRKFKSAGRERDRRRGPGLQGRDGCPEPRTPGPGRGLRGGVPERDQGLHPARHRARAV